MSPRRGLAGRLQSAFRHAEGIYVLAEVEQLPDTDVEGPRDEVAVGTVMTVRVRCAQPLTTKYPLRQRY